MGAFIIYWFINQLLPIRPRPEAFTNLPPLIAHFPDNSFPSGHAMFFGASWWALHKLGQWPRVTYTFFALGCLTVMGRIIAGIHYPGDIIVGFFLGWIIVHVLITLPHGRRYRRYAQDAVVKAFQFIRL
jgi:membrane-associated phospholipid phosphatase